MVRWKTNLHTERVTFEIAEQFTFYTATIRPVYTYISPRFSSCNIPSTLTYSYAYIH